MMNQIVAFDISITRIEAKFKLSQNRTAADSSRVTAALLQSTDQNDRDTGALMKSLET
jgi:transcriptional regulator